MPKAKAKPKRRLGRPPKIASKEVMERLIQALEYGNIIETACACAGMSVRTYYDSQETGESDIENNRNTIFSHFVQEVKRARAEADNLAVLSIQKGMREDWRAGAWRLTHGPNRAEWAEQNRLQLSGDPENPLVPPREILSPEAHVALYADALQLAMNPSGQDALVAESAGGNGKDGNGREEGA